MCAAAVVKGGPESTGLPPREGSPAAVQAACRRYGVETVTAGFTAEEALVVLASMPASEAAAPLPLALAEVPEPELSASALPSAKLSEEALRVPVSTVPSESESI